MKNVEKKRKTYELRLTKMELVHLRDLFSVLLPPAAEKTLSQALAELAGRTVIESLLWQKIGIAAESADIPMGDDAPDYIAAPSSTPAISVFQIAAEPQEEEEDLEDEQEGLAFVKED
jgi:hypothetical protein